MKREPSIPPMRALTISVVCFVLFLIVMAMIFGGCASSNVGKALNVGVGAAKTFDHVSTDRAEARGLVEANPLVGSQQWRQLLVGSLGVGAVIAGARALERSDRPALAHVIRGIAIVAWSAAGVHNWRLAHR